jgi:N-acetylmuramoyl-L-alanine amidase
VPARPAELRGPTGPLVRRVAPGDLTTGYQTPWGRPEGFLSGRTVYLSPGHGFTSIFLGWRTQRGNTNGIVEDLVSAEAVQQYLSRYLRQAGARVVSVREPDLTPALVLVDDSDATGYSEIGPAGRFRSEPTGFGRMGGPLSFRENPFAQGRSRIVTTARQADAFARFVPDIPAAGEYNVYVGYTQDPGRAPDAHYIVRHKGGAAHFRVDQRRHGGTWILLGRFYFQAGARPDRGAVEIHNDSQAEGRTVSLDVVRLGGGMGLHDRGKGLSGRPRWEEAARYHTQFMGAPPSVYDQDDLDDRDDDVGTRSRFAAWDHEEGEEAVYLAWHTNAPSPAVGTSSYVYGPNPPNGSYMFTGTPGSDVMMRLVHDQIVADLRRFYDPGWRDRGKLTAYFGEVNPRHNPEMPAALIEVAFHDTPSDALALKQAHFRRIVARAMYTGIARYFAQQAKQEVRLLPEPPTAVCARQSGRGEVTVTFAPPGPGTPGDPPEGYRVYRSDDGLSWDEGLDVPGTGVVLSGITPGVPLYLRLTAYNRGGESFPTPLLPVRLRKGGSHPAVLLVGGFDRLDGGLLVPEELSRHALGTVGRMLLDRMNDGSYLAAHARAIAAHDVSFDACHHTALERGEVRLADYLLVDWQAGQQSRESVPMTDGARERLERYLQAGGRLILSGSEIIWALTDQGSDTEKAFARGLGLDLVGDDAGTYKVRAVGGLFAGLPEFEFDDGSHGVYDVAYPDVLAPLGGSAELDYVGGTGGAAAISRAGVLTFGFPLEAIHDEAVRAAVLGRALAGLGIGRDPDEVVPPPDTMSMEEMTAGCGCRVARGGPAGPGLGLVALLLGILHHRRGRRRRTWHGAWWGAA